MAYGPAEGQGEGHKRKWRAAVGSAVLALALGVVLLSDPPLWWHRAQLLWNAVLSHATATQNVEPIAVDAVIVPLGRKDAEDLAVVDADTGDIKKYLTSGGAQAGAPTISSDRRTIYYADSNGFVHTMRADGKGDVVLARPDDCPFIRHVSMGLSDPFHLLIQCRDRRTSGQTDFNDSFKLIDLTGLVTKTFNTRSSKMDDPTLSPDGKYLAYWGSSDTLSKGSPGGSIYILKTNGSAEPNRLAYEAGALDADPAWSPDSRTLAFRRRFSDSDSVYTVLRNGSSLHKVLTNAEKPSWSPDGRSLIYVRRINDTRLTLMRSDSTGRNARAIGEGFESLFAPVWFSR